MDVSVSLVSTDRFFREGLNGLLAENGYTISDSIADHRELESDPEPGDASSLVLIDLARDTETAADQLRHLSDNMPEAVIVAFSDERDGDWFTICEDYDVSAFLRKQVSLKALLHCLELVMIGEKVLPASSEAAPRTCAETAVGGAARADRNRASSRGGEVIPCMTCGQPFETEDRRANRICSGCKSRMSRINGATEHTLHY